MRLQGTRVGIETVVRDYWEGASPEEIALRYPTLTLEQIHATITYALAHQTQVDAYLQRVHQRQAAAWHAAQQPSALMRALRTRLAQRRPPRPESVPMSTRDI
jgi:uncharacterized protein (DUF433 family)